MRNKKVIRIPKVLTGYLPHNPIRIGRLKKYGRGLIGVQVSQGELIPVNEKEYLALSKMDGIHTEEEILEEGGFNRGEWSDFVQRLQPIIYELGKWNPLYFCPKCGVYIVRSYKCYICGCDTESSPLFPPCDAWVLSTPQIAFLNSLLPSGPSIPEDSFLIGNEGIFERKYFWRILYRNRLIAVVWFTTEDPAQAVTWLDTGLLNELVTSTYDSYTDTLSKCVLYNETILSTMEDKSLMLIEESLDIFPNKPIALYFSGGKESMVMCEIAKQRNSKNNPIKVLFMDNGIELPSVVEFVKECRSFIEDGDMELFVMEGDYNEVLGVINEKKRLVVSRSPWCRSEIKYRFRNRIISQVMGAEPFVALEGSRKYETMFRKDHPTVNILRDGYRSHFLFHPLNHWDSFSLRLYIKQHEIPMVKLYDLGVNKTTCWFCPQVNPFHRLLAKRLSSAKWGDIEHIDFSGFDTDPYLGHTPY